MHFVISCVEMGMVDGGGGRGVGGFAQENTMILLLKNTKTVRDLTKVFHPGNLRT